MVFSTAIIGESVTDSEDLSKQSVDITKDMHVGVDFLEVGANHMQTAPETRFLSGPSTLQTIRGNNMAACSSLWVKGFRVVRERDLNGHIDGTRQGWLFCSAMLKLHNHNTRRPVSSFWRCKFGRLRIHFHGHVNNHFVMYTGRLLFSHLHLHLHLHQDQDHPHHHQNGWAK